MPKLNQGASAEQMRKDIIKLQMKDMINIDSYIVKFGENRGEYASADILDWTDADVRYFYTNQIDESVFEEYDKMIERENKERDEFEKRKKTIKENRPSSKDPEYVKKVEEIYQPGISKEERDAKLKDLHEELEYRQLEYDSRYETLKGEKAARFDELDQKLSVKSYEEHRDSIKGFQEKLKEATKKLEEYGTRKKPGAFTYAVNWVRRWFSDTDLKSIQEYNEYKNLRANKAKLEGSINNAKTSMEVIQNKNSSFNYAENALQSERRILNLARNIVVKNMAVVSKDKNFDAFNLDKEAVDAAARVVMKDEHFKQTVIALDAGNKEVSQDTFLNMYMSIKGYAALSKVNDEDIHQDIHKLYSNTKTEKIENPEVTNSAPTMSK